MKPLFLLIVTLALLTDLGLARRKHKKKPKSESGIYNVRQESACLKAGGMCRMARDCISSGDPTVDPSEDLCPVQYKRGIRCCQPLPLKERRCVKHGGKCTRNNGKCRGAVFWGAIDCRKKRICCIELLG